MLSQKVAASSPERGKVLGDRRGLICLKSQVSGSTTGVGSETQSQY